MGRPFICKNTEPAALKMPERMPMCSHVWRPHPSSPNYVVLAGTPNALVRVKPTPQGRYLWQFRKVTSFADTVEQAKDYVEAGAEFFAVFARNPYAGG
jgi:hypothetical protein